MVFEGRNVFGGFPGKEGAFAGIAPTVACDDSCFANDAMAGNEVGDGVRTAGGSNGSGGTFVFDGASDLAVAGDATFGNAKESAPDFELKGSAADEGFQLGGGSMVGGENGFAPAVRLPVRAVQSRGGPIFSELLGCAGEIRCLVEGEVANAACVPGESGPAKRGFSEAPSDIHAAAATFNLTWGSRLDIDQQIMQPAGAGQTGIQGGSQDACRCTQAVLGVFGCEALQEIFRRDASPAPKQAMEMGFAQAGGSGKHLQVGLIGVVFIQKANDFFDASEIVHARSVFALAGKPTRFLP